MTRDPRNPGRVVETESLTQRGAHRRDELGTGERKERLFGQMVDVLQMFRCLMFNQMFYVLQMFMRSPSLASSMA